MFFCRDALSMITKMIENQRVIRFFFADLICRVDFAIIIKSLILVNKNAGSDSTYHLFNSLFPNINESIRNVH